MNSFIETPHDNKPVLLSDIPTLNNTEFTTQFNEMLAETKHSLVAYFANPDKKNLQLFTVIADNKNKTLKIFSTVPTKPTDTVNSLANEHPVTANFEREMHEKYGTMFEAHPWLKPIRYTHDRFDQTQTIDNYPFLKTENPKHHLVQVGPVHAGIIEPGAFRFIMQGETILHLEIAMGYQHRGVENLMINAKNDLTKMSIAEQIAGDSTVAHAIATALILEQGSKNPVVDSGRIIALELERIAMHIADTAALSNDIAYQLGQVTAEALRTITINTTQLWCGNRFGRTLVRPHGTHYPLTLQLIEQIKTNLNQVIKRYNTLAQNLLSTPTLLARFDEVGKVDRNVALKLGAVGMAAKMTGIPHDTRTDFAFSKLDDFNPKVQQSGDILARLKLRIEEVNQSNDIIENEFKKVVSTWFNTPSTPIYNNKLKQNSITISLVEGWRGMIVHAAITDEMGTLQNYKIYDPSFRNWAMLAHSVRNAEISDFPISNKSFNLSYAGADL